MSSGNGGASCFLRNGYYLLLLLSATVLLSATAFAPPASTCSAITTRLHFSDTNKDPLTTAKRERRDEDVRRNDRKAEVVPGKTSAIPGARDYPLNPAATTEEWMKHASKVEQQVYRYTEEGMNALKMVRLVGRCFSICSVTAALKFLPCSDCLMLLYSLSLSRNSMFPTLTLTNIVART